MGSDYRGLKRHIATVREHQESDDKKYRSSLYPGNPSPTHVLWFPIAGELPSSFAQRRLAHGMTFGTTEQRTGEGALRSSAKYSLNFPRRARQPRVNIKETDEVKKQQPIGSCYTHQPRNRPITPIF